VNLQIDYFALHGLPVRFALDGALLEARYKQLQSQVHPDRYATATAAEQRQAMQWSVRVNEAYQALKDPLKRAAYLCELNGAPIHEHSNTAMPAAFLMQQIEWREALDDASGADELDTLAAQVRAEHQRLSAELAALLDTAHDYAAAAQTVRMLMFVQKFSDAVAEASDDVLDNA
jgi:molecular chaperone HscB